MATSISSLRRIAASGTSTLQHVHSLVLLSNCMNAPTSGARCFSAAAAKASFTSSSSSSQQQQNNNNNNTIPLSTPPPIIDVGAAIRTRRGPQRISSLDANPYAWPETERIAKQAPLWMLYEAEREETIMRKKTEVGSKQTQDSNQVGLLEVPLLDELGRSYATGRRKTSTARVWVKRGDGHFSVNDKPLAEYFSRLTLRQAAIQPFVVTQSCGAFDIIATVKGGGMSGQAGAVRHGVAKALSRFDPELKPLLRQFQLLQRDPRMVERKKPGQKKARKKFQWVKR